MAEITKIILVGHCGADSGMLDHVAHAAFKGIDVVRANSDAALTDASGPTTLSLVNRLLEGRFAADDGIDLIRQYARDADRGRFMLISNYADAQQDAVNAGGLPGFGKSDAYEEKTTELLQAASD